MLSVNLLTTFLGLIVINVWIDSVNTFASPAYLDLDACSTFSVAAKYYVNSTGSTILYGDVGVYPGHEIIGFPPGKIEGAIHIADSTVIACMEDIDNAIFQVSLLSEDMQLSGDIGGMTLAPGVYRSDFYLLTITGTLILDGQNDPNAAWIFHIGSTLFVNSSAQVKMINYDQTPGLSVWWNPWGALILDNATLPGTVMTTNYIFTGEGAMTGPLLTYWGDVTLNSSISYSLNSSSPAPSSPPTLQPTPAVPSANPSITPTAPPTVIPSAVPSDLPTVAPSSIPTYLPTPSPSTLPTMSPSANPTVDPTPVPTEIPTLDPSNAPSIIPSAVPSAVPSTAAPSIIPTMAPSNAPTIVPTTFPTAIPTMAPSNTPTLVPSAVPSEVPTAQPTTAPPTANPTMSLCPPGTSYANASSPNACETCPPGYFSDTYGGAAQCSPCPAGQFAPSPASTTCSPCAQGTYADTEGSATCTPCPVGTISDTEGADSLASCVYCQAGQYSDSPGSITCELCDVGTYGTAGTGRCTVCPANRLTAEKGALGVTDCLNPIANFVQGVLAFVASFIIAVIYILYGRMNAVAFGRKRHLQEVGKTYVALMAAIARVPLDALPEKPTDFEKYAKMLAFFIVGIAVFVGTTFFLCFMIFGQVFFAAMIIWRNVRLSININFIEHMTDAIAQLDDIIGAYLPIEFMFGWIFLVMQMLASLNIELTAMEVTCVGSQAPIRLLMNLVLFVAIVILIECDVAAFLATSFYRTHEEYRSVVANSKARNTIDYTPRNKLRRWLFSSIETGIFSSRLIVNVLQYAVSFISLEPFFAYYGIHASTAGCNNVSGVLYIDTILAVGSSVILYCMIPALLYTISKLLVPRLLKKDRVMPLNEKDTSHAMMVKSIQNQRVTLRYSFIPSVDYFVSWRFKWAYNVLHAHKFTNKDELMFLRKDDPPVDPPTGIGMCPLISTSNSAFQYEWVNECDERLPPYGLFFTGACMRYMKIVLKNFWTFFNVILGVWDANSVRKFNIINTLIYNGFDIAHYLDQPLYESSSKTPMHVSMGKLMYRCFCCFCSGQVHSEFIPEDGGESRLQVAALVAAELSTRATLFMLIPFGSLITTYVSSTSANPIFCRRAKKLSKLLPGLLMFDSHLLADKRVRQMGPYARWKVRLMSICIFVTESRLVKYLFSLMCYIMALSVIFYPVIEFLALGVMIILLYCMFASLYPIVVVANILEVNDEEEAHTDGSDEEEEENGGFSEEPKVALTSEPALRRQSSNRRGSNLRRGSCTLERRGSDYNFYVDDEEDEDSDAGVAAGDTGGVRGSLAGNATGEDIEMGKLRRPGDVVVGAVTHTPMMERLSSASDTSQAERHSESGSGCAHSDGETERNTSSKSNSPVGLSVKPPPLSTPQDVQMTGEPSSPQSPRSIGRNRSSSYPVNSCGPLEIASSRPVIKRSSSLPVLSNSSSSSDRECDTCYPECGGTVVVAGAVRSSTSSAYSESERSDGSSECKRSHDGDPSGASDEEDGARQSECGGAPVEAEAASRSPSNSESELSEGALEHEDEGSSSASDPDKSVNSEEDDEGVEEEEEEDDENDEDQYLGWGNGHGEGEGEGGEEDDGDGGDFADYADYPEEYAFPASRRGSAAPSDFSCVYGDSTDYSAGAGGGGTTTTNPMMRRK